MQVKLTIFDDPEIIVAVFDDVLTEQMLAEELEPRLLYSPLTLRTSVAVSEQELLAEVMQQEPNVIVKRLYQKTITDELDYLHLIEATYPIPPRSICNTLIRTGCDATWRRSCAGMPPLHLQYL